MKNLINILVVSLLISIFGNLAFAENIYLLTQPLQMAATENLKIAESFSVSSQPTLLKKISEDKGVVKVQMVQVNGQPSDKIYYVSAKWFNQGTRTKAIDPFQVDPNKIIKDINNKRNGTCPPEVTDPPKDPKEEDVKVAESPYVKDACFILTGAKNDFTKKEKEDLHMACFDSIKKKLDIDNQDSAYSAISKLYSLPTEQQIFMARLLTMFGEASGAIPPAEQMAAVLQVIDNRTRVAKKKYPKANQLDVVLQNSQFSMFNPKDFNWKRSLFASKLELASAIHVITDRDSYKIKSTSTGKLPSTVYHYMAVELCGGANHPAWAVPCENSTSISVNKVKLESENGHVFFNNVAWSFNPNNRYKVYARSHGITK